MEIILDRRQQVLHLPSAALQQDRDQTFVWIVDPDGQALRGRPYIVIGVVGTKQDAVPGTRYNPPCVTGRQ